MHPAPHERTNSQPPPQTPPGDEDRRARTSEGLLVFGRASTDFAEVPDLAVGALARAEGVVTEFAQRDGLTITEVVIQSNDDVAVCDGARSWA